MIFGNRRLFSNGGKAPITQDIFATEHCEMGT